ncbi:MAG TPA: ABC transporter permease [bacterium]|nr:ABC transporter permease [bacterium]
MIRYLARRLLQALPLLLLVSAAVFFLINIVPGGPTAAYENNPRLTSEDIARIEAELGLNQPIHVRYLRWLGAVAHGDWGYSLVTKRPVLVEIGERFPNTLYLIGIQYLVTLAIAIPAGTLSAVRQYSVFDHATTTVAFMGQSIPIFWFGLILIIVFHVTLRNPLSGLPLLPAGGMYTIGEPFSAGDRIQHLILPVAMLTLANCAAIVRYVRASMIEVLHADYIRTARSKGASGRRVVWGHALKNAALPVVTIIALDLPVLFGGALFTETIFSWPGMGRLFYDSALRFDYALLMSIVMITAILIVLSNLAADVGYAYLDPRIRYG